MFISQPATTKKLIGLTLLSSLVSLSCLAPSQPATAAPGNTPPQAYNNYLAAMGKTSLALDSNFITTQTIMGKATTISFDWKTTNRAAVAGKWAVADSPTGANLATGFTSNLTAGTVGQFSIDFSKFAPPNPPDQSAEKIYYITVAPVNAGHIVLGLPSNVVKVIYFQSK
jgi:hypothetical protein